VPRYIDAYRDRELPLLEVTQAELDSQPEAFKEMRRHNVEVDHDSVFFVMDPTREQRHRQRAYYLANVTMIDEKIGAIIAALETRGYLENAILIFTSDHGDCLSDHGQSQKWTMYEQVIRMPLIVWAPGRFAPAVVDAMVQQMDIGPAILELAGCEVPSWMEARSLLPALRGEAFPGREHVFAEQARDLNFTGTDFMTMVRSPSEKLVHFLGEPYGQLFDLVRDPDELRNLWDDPAHADRKRALLDVLREWRIRSGYETSEWAAEWR
jgi:arylsulfatase A-like enzyme